MDKYKNGKIYTIRNRNDDSLIYVGSTVQPLYKRFAVHKSHSKLPKDENMQLYKKMNEIDINDWYIELFEDYPCDRKEQLLQREGQVIREIATLNKNVPGRTKQDFQEIKKKYRDDHKEKNQEYRDDHKEKNPEYFKEYYEDNKEQINKRNNEYYKDNKEKIKEKMKEYRENNQEYFKEYRETNKEQIQKNKSKIVLCECGCSICKSVIAKHKRTHKHLDIMKELAKTQEQTI
jgi:hypothetical protein